MWALCLLWGAIKEKWIVALKLIQMGFVSKVCLVATAAALIKHEKDTVNLFLKGIPSSATKY